MITANELAIELNASVDDVLTLLADIRELALTPDSGVRDEVADAVRGHFHTQESVEGQRALAADAQLVGLRQKPSGAAPRPSPETGPALDFHHPNRRKRRSTGRGWRRGDDRLDPITKALADQIVAHSHVRYRQDGVIFPDELAEAQQRRTAWAKACIEKGALLTDHVILGWVLAFPDEILEPQKIVPLAAAGLTSDGAILRLWYGRINSGRPTLLQRIRSGDLTVTQAISDLSKYEQNLSG